jgi:hypothetical protein
MSDSFQSDRTARLSLAHQSPQRKPQRGTGSQESGPLDLLHPSAVPVLPSSLRLSLRTPRTLRFILLLIETAAARPLTHVILTKDRLVRNVNRWLDPED